MKVDPPNRLAPHRVVANTSSTPPPGADVLRVEHLGKAFGTTVALADVSLTIAPGEVRCLLGENGAGKSTLCNIVFGVYAADRGHLFFRGREWRPTSPREAIEGGVAMVHQHFNLIPTLSVLDNFLLGRSRGLLDRRAGAREVEEAMRKLGVSLDLDARVESVSVSGRQTIEIVKCLLARPALLVLDEPTAVLPVAEIDALLETIRKVSATGCGVLLVTHKLAEVVSAADSVTVLRHGRVVAESAHPEGDIAHLASAMVGRDYAPLGRRRAATSAPSAGGTVRDALIVDGVHARDDKGNDRLANFTLVVRTGEIVGVAGVEGNGQTELGQVIAGIRRPSQGRIHLGAVEITGASPRSIFAAGAGIIPEDRHAVGCVLEMSVAENLFLGELHRFTNRLGLLDRRRMEAAAEQLIESYGIRCAGPRALMRELSGGNQQKVVLARELSRRGLKFVLAAQPTRGLDVGAVESVYRCLEQAAEKGAGILLITTELDELFQVCDRIVVIYRGRVAKELRPAEYSRETVGSLMSGEALAA